MNAGPSTTTTDLQPARPAPIQRPPASDESAGERPVTGAPRRTRSTRCQGPGTRSASPARATAPGPVPTAITISPSRVTAIRQTIHPPGRRRTRALALSNQEAGGRPSVLVKVSSFQRSGPSAAILVDDDPAAPTPRTTSDHLCRSGAGSGRNRRLLRAQFDSVGTSAHAVSNNQQRQSGWSLTHAIRPFVATGSQDPPADHPGLLLFVGFEVRAAQP